MLSGQLQIIVMMITDQIRHLDGEDRGKNRQSRWHQSRNVLKMIIMIKCDQHTFPKYESDHKRQMVRNVVIFTFSTSGQISTVNDRRSSTVCLSIIIINTHSSPQYMLGGQRELHNKPRPGTKPSFTSSLSSLSTYSSVSAPST